MSRNIYAIMVIGGFLLPTLSDVAQPMKSGLNTNAGPGICGQASYGLQPLLVVEQLDANWWLRIYYEAQTNFPEYTWLKITNSVGAKLQVWLTNGTELKSRDADVLSAMVLPRESTVADIMRGTPGGLSRRGMQWMATDAGHPNAASGFRMEEAFDISITNDLILTVTPLIYKVETNRVTAHLVEFAPIKIKLTADGKVQKQER